MSYQQQKTTPRETLAWLGVGLTMLALFVGISVGGCAGLKAFNRAQARADAANRVSITAIQIRNQEQYAKVIAAQNASVAAQAQQRFIQAVGIRRAQDEIAKTLTPLYIQHEAIQAEEEIANSGRNNTVVYVPAGAQGVPIVTQGTKP